MPTREFPDLSPRSRPSASELNRQSRAVEQLLNIQGDGVQQDNTGTMLRPPDIEVYEVLITGVDTTQSQARYSGVEQQRDEQGNPSNKPGGLTFNFDYLPLYERNNISTVPTGKIVEARQGDGAFYLFTAPAGVAAASAGSKTVIIDSVNPVSTDGLLTIYSGAVVTYDVTAGQYLFGEPAWVASNDPEQQLAENVQYQADPSGQFVAENQARTLYLTDTATLAEEAGCAGPFTRGFVCPKPQDLPYGIKTFTSLSLRGGDPMQDGNNSELTAQPACFWIQNQAVVRDPDQWTICSLTGGGPSYFTSPVQFDVFGCVSVFTNQYRTFLQNRLPDGSFIIARAFDQAASEWQFSPFPQFTTNGPVRAKSYFAIDQQANGNFKVGGTFQDTMTGLRFEGGLAIGYGVGGNLNQSFGPFPDNWLN